MPEKILAQDLKPGDLFTVEPPDPEGPVRVCLTNNKAQGIRWGFPGGGSYWCYMGERCEVTLVERRR